jgi:hypothetical protein
MIASGSRSPLTMSVWVRMIARSCSAVRGVAIAPDIGFCSYLI